MAFQGLTRLEGANRGPRLCLRRLETPGALARAYVDLLGRLRRVQAIRLERICLPFGCTT
ncbi:MAG: hypothetical protein WBZ00_10965 [Solirubrobacterales bacterium]